MNWVLLILFYGPSMGTSIQVEFQTELLCRTAKSRVDAGVTKNMKYLFLKDVRFASECLETKNPPKYLSKGKNK